MKNIKTLLVLGLSFGLFFTACENGNSDVDLNDDDLEVAAQVAADALSDDSEGLMAALYDASASVGSTSMNHRFGVEESNDKSDLNLVESASTPGGRGAERNYSHSYDPATGEHTISFSRSFTRTGFTKTMEGSATHVYTDTLGEYVEFPRQNRDAIETATYVATKTGSMEGEVRNGSFERSHNLSLAGLSEQSAITTVNGTQSGSGSYAGPNRDGDDIERQWSNSFTFTNIQLDKAVIEENGTIEAGITGTFDYDVNIIRAVNGGEPEVTELEGTIELTGDGTALLEFKGAARIFRIALGRGSVSETNRRR